MNITNQKVLYFRCIGSYDQTREWLTHLLSQNHLSLNTGYDGGFCYVFISPESHPWLLETIRRIIEEGLCNLVPPRKPKVTQLMPDSEGMVRVPTPG
jgi:hypothetical protein